MLDHIMINVKDFEKSKAFYKAILAPLGYIHIWELQGWAGFSADGKPDSCWGFWIQGGKQVLPPIHVAFRSDSRAKIRAFYHAALKAGGRDNGPPGIREHYHPNYYGAFVYDFDGHNIEAVSHTPE
ncbi:MAG: VOC family protein [Gammaproteobacteria bacterium]|nr:VOC family protein [Gammaproteobacteria bacterium]